MIMLASGILISLATTKQFSGSELTAIHVLEKCIVYGLGAYEPTYTLLATPLLTTIPNHLC